MSSGPPRWARAAACAAAVAIAVGAAAGPFASVATAHGGPSDDDTERSGVAVPAHKTELWNEVRGHVGDPVGNYAQFGDTAEAHFQAFLWDMPLPVDEDGWWPGWRRFGDWTSLFWPPDGRGNAVKGPEKPDLESDVYPYGHPLVNHRWFASAAEDEDLADRVWAAAEHFCAVNMTGTKGAATAAHVWSLDETGGFYDKWRKVSPFHPDYGSIHGRLLTVTFGSGERIHEKAAELSGMLELIWDDRDGHNDIPWTTDKGETYAANPYGEWLLVSDGLTDPQLDLGLFVARHGRCPQPVIEWWMWYLLWHEELEPSKVPLTIVGSPVGWLASQRGVADEETVDWTTSEHVDFAVYEDLGVDPDDVGGEVNCPLTWPETINDGYNSAHEGNPQFATGNPDGENPAITELDVLFWQVAKENIFAFHTLAHLVGCTNSGPLAARVPGGDADGYAVSWWLQAMWHASRGLRPPGTFAIDWATDLWAGDVGPPFSKYQVRSDVGSDVREGLLLVGGLITSGLANLAAVTAGDWVLATFTLNPLQSAADGVIAGVEKTSRDVVAVGGNLWRIIIMCLIAWAAWQMARKRKVAGTFREVGLSVLLFTVLTATAAFGLGTTLKSVVGVLQSAIGGAATVLTPQQGCYVYVPHADPAEVQKYIQDEYKGKPEDLWKCDGDPNPVPLDPNGWGSVPRVLPVVAGTTCLWPAEYASLTLGGGIIANEMKGADELRLCPIRHLLKETLTIGPVWGNNLGAQQLAHSVVDPIPDHLSGWACVMWARPDHVRRLRVGTEPVQHRRQRPHRPDGGHRGSVRLRLHPVTRRRPSGRRQLARRQCGLPFRQPEKRVRDYGTFACVRSGPSCRHVRQPGRGSGRVHNRCGSHCRDAGRTVRDYRRGRVPAAGRRGSGRSWPSPTVAVAVAAVYDPHAAAGRRPRRGAAAVLPPDEHRNPPRRCGGWPPAAEQNDRGRLDDHIDHCHCPDDEEEQDALRHSGENDRESAGPDHQAGRAEGREAEHAGGEGDRSGEAAEYHIARRGRCGYEKAGSAGRAEGDRIGVGHDRRRCWETGCWEGRNRRWSSRRSGNGWEGCCEVREEARWGNG